MVGHIHIMIIELLMKLDVILKNVGCTVTKMLDHNSIIITLHGGVIVWIASLTHALLDSL